MIKAVKMLTNTDICSMLNISGGVMERYKIITGKDLTLQQYLATWELDNVTFEAKDLLTKEQAIDWYHWSNASTIVLWDTQKDRLVGYITPFLFNHKFASAYINSNANFSKAIKQNCFVEPKADIVADIYLFSTVVQPEYRDRQLDGTSKGSPFYKKSAFKVLNEAFVDWVCQVKEQGVSINYIFAEKVSDDGQKYLESMNLQQCFAMKDDTKYAKLFSPAIFEKCSNVSKLYDLYQKENIRDVYDLSLLDGHEYLSVKDNVLYYKDINLIKLVEKYKAPLEIAYTPMITEKVKTMKAWFADKIAKHQYQGKYNYAYATKANYYSEVVLTALGDVDMLETSSAYDIDIIKSLVKNGYLKPGFTVLCNGFKNKKYIDTLEYLLKKKINVIPII